MWALYYKFYNLFDRKTVQLRADVYVCVCVRMTLVESEEYHIDECFVLLLCKILVF